MDIDSVFFLYVLSLLIYQALSFCLTICYKYSVYSTIYYIYLLKQPRKPKKYVPRSYYIYLVIQTELYVHLYIFPTKSNLFISQRCTIRTRFHLADGREFSAQIYVICDLQLTKITELCSEEKLCVSRSGIKSKKIIVDKTIFFYCEKNIQIDVLWNCVVKRVNFE